MSNLVEMRLIFHSLRHEFPVRLIMSGVLFISIYQFGIHGYLCLLTDRVTVIQEVHIKDGTARATSVKANSPWTADKAFSLGGNRAWHNGAARLV